MASVARNVCPKPTTARALLASRVGARRRGRSRQPRRPRARRMPRRTRRGVGLDLRGSSVRAQRRVPARARLGAGWRRAHRVDHRAGGFAARARRSSAPRSPWPPRRPGAWAAWTPSCSWTPSRGSRPRAGCRERVSLRVRRIERRRSARRDAKATALRALTKKILVWPRPRSPGGSAAGGVGAGRPRRRRRRRLGRRAGRAEFGVGRGRIARARSCPEQILPRAQAAGGRLHWRRS